MQPMTTLSITFSLGPWLALPSGLTWLAFLLWFIGVVGDSTPNRTPLTWCLFMWLGILYAKVVVS